MHSSAPLNTDHFPNLAHPERGNGGGKKEHGIIFASGRVVFAVAIWFFGDQTFAVISKKAQQLYPCLRMHNVTGPRTVTLFTLLTTEK